jgi:hypothetical protein
MAPRSPELYGIPIKEIARICRVSIKTATRWKSGKTCPPVSARLLLAGDMGCLDSGWDGWRVRNSILYSPEGWPITPNEVLAVPLMRAQIVAYQLEQRKVLALAEQPAVEEWPEWVFEKLG